MKKRTYSVLSGLLWFGYNSAFGLPLDYLMPPIGYDPPNVIHHKKQTLTLVDNLSHPSHNKKTESSSKRNGESLQSFASLPHKTA
jgi:hypothetical protein